MSVKLTKALTVANIQNQRITRVPFKGDFYQAFREPQNKGVWFVWGGSSSGKSTFLMQLAKEFARTGLKVSYNLLEEETDDSDYIERTELVGMSDVKDNFVTVSYNYEECLYYLEKRTTRIDVLFIDSGGYFFRSFEQYLEFKAKHKKLIIVISGHAQGSNPRSDMEKSIMYNAKQKIYVTGYLAVCKGRTIGPNKGLYIIYQEGYEQLRGATKNENE